MANSHRKRGVCPASLMAKGSQTAATKRCKTVQLLEDAAKCNAVLPRELTKYGLAPDLRNSCTKSFRWHVTAFINGESPLAALVFKQETAELCKRRKDLPELLTLLKSASRVFSSMR